MTTCCCLENHINDRDTVRWFRGKRARDGAAPESGQEDPLREERYQCAGSYAQSACAFDYCPIQTIPSIPLAIEIKLSALQI